MKAFTRSHKENRLAKHGLIALLAFIFLFAGASGRFTSASWSPVGDAAFAAAPETAPLESTDEAGQIEDSAFASRDASQARLRHVTPRKATAARQLPPNATPKFPDVALNDRVFASTIAAQLHERHITPAGVFDPLATGLVARGPPRFS